MSPPIAGGGRYNRKLNKLAAESEDNCRKQAWVLKNSSQEIRQNKIASGCSINDFLGSPRHFLSPNFRCFEGKATFSTATGHYTHNPTQPDFVCLLISSRVRVSAFSRSMSSSLSRPSVESTTAEMWSDSAMM